MSSHGEDVLSDFISNQRWDEVKSRIWKEEGREELRRKWSQYGLLPLHRCCSGGAPLELIEAMVVQYPDAVRVTDRFGCYTPLHWACSRGIDVSPRVVRLLLEAYPEGAKAIDVNGHLPLHHAARGKAPLEVLRMFIDTHPEGSITRNNYGRLPLHEFSFVAFPDHVEDTEKVALLLRPILESEKACRVSVPDAGETPLHIAAKFRLLSLRTCTALPWCPPDVIMTVARRHPGQLRERDLHGSLPLHRVVANPNLNGAKDAGEDIVGKLIDLNPNAAVASDAEGKFPLVLAIESGKKWNEGVAALADAAEHVITVRDEATNLFPFMLAATSDDACLTTVYSLLKRCPELKRYLLE